MSTEIEKNREVILQYLYQTAMKLGSDASVNGDDIHKATNLEPSQINDAIELLDNAHLVELLTSMMTAPYDFYSVKITAKGKNEIRRIRGEFEFPLPPLEKAWQFQADSNIGERGLTTAYNQIYFATKEGNIYALDATGQAKWTFKMGKELELPRITAADGLIFAASKDKNLYAINIETGKMQWQFSTGKEFVGWSHPWGPVTADGTVYIATKDKKLHALDTQTGKVQWQFQADGEIHTPAISAETIFFGCKDKKVYALNAKSGQKLWETKIGHEKCTPPIIAYGKVLIGGDDDLFALDLNNGTTLWSVKKALSYQRLPAIANGFAFCTSELSVVDLASGKQVEKLMATLPIQQPIQERSAGKVDVVDGTLIAELTVTSWSGQKWYDVKQNLFIIAYDIATRKQKWYDHLPSQVRFWEIAAPYIYAAVFGSKLIVLNTAEPLMLKWESERLPSGVTGMIGKPVIAYGMVFISCGNTVHAFRGYVGRDFQGEMELRARGFSTGFLTSNDLTET